jgi:hypothetical protein
MSEPNIKPLTVDELSALEVSLIKNGFLVPADACQLFATAKALQAQVSSLREALEAQKAFDDHATDCDPCQNGYHCVEGADLSTKAQKLQSVTLSSTSGQDLLERLSKAEAHNVRLQSAIRQAVSNLAPLNDVSFAVPRVAHRLSAELEKEA